MRKMQLKILYSLLEMATSFSLNCGNCLQNIDIFYSPSLNNSNLVNNIIINKSIDNNNHNNNKIHNY